ncbi:MULTISPECIES: flagellar biosynthesis protein FlhB [unclassified Saccharibacter]|uniref:EscU/YscU/HrcU family type III secretion system export apparatus switch protein n=1 Tax=unclassified Saccharibacter TaxID=2648722 RepID=UPI0013269334|nr:MULTISPECIES: EscU/YscU/HrcU family type III secretion system export apparatus switch protein [unclassified Saccharibacter]MXV36028.1 flagellar type III secretion system protein FlhB [Saccharibacter sp. EH611]MXV56887.1 flagellar type III secretion system protein FlhB [Saccharibacter sp. EH70]MXV66753.1 flagellar type III secretion system protein FlhB [Saccharibacter sp. EH60]
MAEEGGGGGGEKSQDPTEKRLEKAREEGNVAQSKELLLLVSLGTFVLVFSITIVKSASVFLTTMKGIFTNIGLLSSDPAILYTVMQQAARGGLQLALPIMITGACAVLACGVLQTRFLFRPQALKPDPSRLSPMKGIKRVFGLNNLIEMLKTLAKFAVFGLILYIVACETLRIAPQSERWAPPHLMSELKNWFLYATLLVIIVQCVITVMDELWSRYHRFSKLKMSFQDIKDETKQTDGDPQVKAKLRQIRTSRSRRRMMSSVKESTVVVTNPTHYAVAIYYDQNAGSAPKIVAKGVDELAFRIRDTARGAKVPVVSNPPLARALHTLPLDTEIPEEFWKPVAAIIAYVVKLKTPGARVGGP